MALEALVDLKIEINPLIRNLRSRMPILWVFSYDLVGNIGVFGVDLE